MDKNLFYYKMWGEITYPFPNCNGAAIEVLGMDKQFHPTFHVITYARWD